MFFSRTYVTNYYKYDSSFREQQLLIIKRDPGDLSSLELSQALNVIEHLSTDNIL